MVDRRGERCDASTSVPRTPAPTDAVDTGVVIDEPMVGLDPHSIRLVKDLLRSYATEGKVVLMSTHTLTVAEEIADRVGVMYAGRMVEIAETRELFAKPRHPYTRGLIDCMPKIDAHRHPLPVLDRKSEWAA